VVVARQWAKSPMAPSKQPYTWRLWEHRGPGCNFRGRLGPAWADTGSSSMSGASKQAHPDGGRTWRLGAIANGARKPKSEKRQKDQKSDLDNTTK